MAPTQVSIITPSLNQGAFIEQTIHSVLRQTYPHVDYIVVDGGSTDTTLATLEQYSITVLHEPQSNQSHAINTGLAHATGDVCAWLNADDLYYPHTIATIVNYFDTHPEAMCVYGDVEVIGRRGTSYGRRPYVQLTTFDELVHTRNRIVQPGMFWRADVWEKLGPLDETLEYVMDYEYWMRIAAHYPLHYLPVCLAQERLHPQAKTFGGSLQRITEIEIIAKRHHAESIPANFRAEAAAVYIACAWGDTLAGRWPRTHLHAALTMKPPLFKFLRHLLTTFTGRYAAYLWLIYNRLQNEHCREQP
ncbi:MAG: glycosyltransferase family 2 protein [Chloroflexota bacterium]